MKIEPHSWYRPKWLARDLCRYCGLVGLRNPLTKWCIEHGCEYREHPHYTEKVKELSR